MFLSLANEEFPISLHNIPRTFPSRGSIAEVVEYFLKNPDLNTAVVLDSEKNVLGVVSKNDLLEYLYKQVDQPPQLAELMNGSHHHLLLKDLNYETISQYVKNNFEDLIIVNQEGKYQSLTTCFELAKLLIKKQEAQGKSYLALLDSAHNGIIAVDCSGKVVFLNKAAEKMLGESSETVAHRPITDLIPDSKLPQVLKSGRPEVTRRHRKGELTFFTYRSPVEMDGQTVGAMAQFVDVAHADDPLHELADEKDFVNLLEMVLDNAYVGLIFCDPQGIIRFMNRLYEELLGIDREETYGKHITEYFPDSRLPVVIKTGEAELGWKYKFQGKTTLVVNRIPIRKKGKLIGVIAQCIFRDISELKDMARKLDLLENKVRDYEAELKNLLAPRYGFSDILGRSEPIIKVKHLAELYARTDAPVLITGETGTGKELFAHAIHGASNRSEGPFVCLNCAAIPSELVESELFGYVPGAFTGAHRQGKIGKIKLAHGGTLFLDEIGDLPLQIQAKLLRVIEQKVVEKVGAVHPTEVDFRLVAATNKDLTALISEGKFREDLYYRLGTMVLIVPSLRKRIEDIPILAQHFLSQKNHCPMNISDAALALLMNHNWRGNVRELRSVMESALSLVEQGNTIEAHHLNSYIVAEEVLPNPEVSAMELGLKKIVQEEEKEAITRALKMCQGNKTRAARILGISRSLLYNKLKGYQIQTA